MSSPYIAEIRIVGFNFAPKNWALCDGQTLAVSQNTALFSIIGVTYGGNGTTEFQLPNLQGCAPLQAGAGTNLNSYNLGQTGGTQTVTLGISQMPLHTHPASCVAQGGTSLAPNENFWAEGGVTRGQLLYSNGSEGGMVSMNAEALSLAGGSVGHNNMPPYQVLNFIIALTGVFPSRS